MRLRVWLAQKPTGIFDVGYVHDNNNIYMIFHLVDISQSQIWGMQRRMMNLMAETLSKTGISNLHPMEYYGMKLLIPVISASGNKVRMCTCKKRERSTLQSFTRNGTCHNITTWCKPVNVGKLLQMSQSRYGQRYSYANRTIMLPSWEKIMTVLTFSIVNKNHHI